MENAVVFDMDGTLIKTELILEEALGGTLKALERNGIRYIDNPIDKYNEIMGVPLSVVWRNLLYKPSDHHIYMANRYFQNALISCIKDGGSELYEGVLEVLKGIKDKGYKIFIVSNGDRDYLEAIYEAHQLDRFISAVYSINDIESSRKSDLLRYMIEKENVKVEYVVGDRLSDFIAGKENDAHVIGCKFYFSKEDELTEADDVITSIDELEALIH